MRGCLCVHIIFFVTIIVIIISVMRRTEEKKPVISRQKGKSGTSSKCMYRFSNIGTYIDKTSDIENSSFFEKVKLLYATLTTLCMSMLLNFE